jgi:hypothetical protein
MQFVFYNLNFASVEFAAYARRRACSCSVLPQMPCNAADAVKSARIIAHKAEDNINDGYSCFKNEDNQFHQSRHMVNSRQGSFQNKTLFY